MINLSNYNKIIIVGSGGSGKSYLAGKLGEILNLPVIYLDNEFWKPNWIKTPKDEWICRQNEIIRAEKWVIDGNYNSTMELRFCASELIIFLDINRFICIWSVWRRHGKKRADLPHYLDEKIDIEFFKFLKWIWGFPKKGKKRIIKLHAKYPDKTFMVIKSRRQVKDILRSLK